MDMSLVLLRSRLVIEVEGPQRSTIPMELLTEAGPGVDGRVTMLTQLWMTMVNVDELVNFWVNGWSTLDEWSLW